MSLYNQYFGIIQSKKLNFCLNYDDMTSKKYSSIKFIKLALKIQKSL